MQTSFLTLKNLEIQPFSTELILSQSTTPAKELLVQGTVPCTKITRVRLYFFTRQKDRPLGELGIDELDFNLEVNVVIDIHHILAIKMRDTLNIENKGVFPN